MKIKELVSKCPIDFIFNLDSYFHLEGLVGLDVENAVQLSQLAC